MILDFIIILLIIFNIFLLLRSNNKKYKWYFKILNRIEKLESLDKK